MGMTRRMQHYDNVGLAALADRRRGGALRSFWPASSARSCSSSSRSATASGFASTGDPWNGRTLEWSTASPPPAWNFAVLPQVAERRRLLGQEATRRRDSAAVTDAPVRPIEMPKNSAIGFVTAFFAVVTGFALIWHIWWMAGIGLLGVVCDRARLRISRSRRNRNPGRAVARVVGCTDEIAVERPRCH